MAEVETKRKVVTLTAEGGEAVQQGQSLLSLLEVAAQLRVTKARVRYQVTSRRVQPDAVRGRQPLFCAATVERIAAALRLKPLARGKVALYSAATVARALGVSRQRVSQLVKAGKLRPSHYHRGRPYFDGATVRRAQANRKARLSATAPSAS